MNSNVHTELVNHVWAVADLLRGDYKQSDYGKVILPFTVLRRLECVLEPTRDAVRFRAQEISDGFDEESQAMLLERAAGHEFYNTSEYTLKLVISDPNHTTLHLSQYVSAFSENVRQILDKYDFDQQIRKLAEANLLYQVAGKFADIDLHPNRVSNHQMGYVFEELIRRFSEASNETAGEHFTPREVIQLMVELLIGPDDEALTQPGVIRTVLDPACGTGGMLTAAEEHITNLNNQANVKVFGQELNPESWAICQSDLLIKGQDADDSVAFGNSFSHDGHVGKTFDYLLANPPFGVEWKKVQKAVADEHQQHGHDGRFGAGLPRINDGSLLFLQHMIAKMKPVEKGGSRIAIVFNGSPLFTGGAESGESNIRKWIIENDWLEAVVALPDQLFYNTGIATYFWIVTNRKASAQRGKVVLLDARDKFAKMRKSLGDKRKHITPDQIATISRLYSDALAVAADPDHPEHRKVKIFANEDFGFQRITVERPLKLRFEISDETLAAIRSSKKLTKFLPVSEFADALSVLVGQSWSTKKAAWNALHEACSSSGLDWPGGAAFDKALREAVGVRDDSGEVQLLKGSPEPDPELRDNENVPLAEDIDEYFAREVTPHVPDAWVDEAKTKIGYEIPFTRHFYEYTPPRPLAEIDAELKALESEIQHLLAKVTE